MSKFDLKKFKLNINEFAENGAFLKMAPKHHIYDRAFGIEYTIDHYFSNETWDNNVTLLNELNEIIDLAKKGKYTDVQDHYEQMVVYLKESQMWLEHDDVTRAPWLDEKINNIQVIKIF